MVHIEDIKNFDDEATWDLICSGRTKGVFQLESRLGSSWAKRAQPRSIDELADLVSIIRPGTLEAELDGKSMTKHYTDRKAKIDETKYLHPALETVLGKTYGIIVYQEQAMRIATEIAGFTPEEADSLRKAMGKKDAALMKEVEEKFINGAKTKGLVDDVSAAKIFEWIAASARYSFNKCLDPNTLVETKHGEFKTLTEVQVGEYIKAPDGFVEVVNKYDNGIKDVVEITMESGKSITCTIDHKFLCSDGNIYPLYEILENKYEIACDLD
jgi:intein/homing endonuclease